MSDPAYDLSKTKRELVEMMKRCSDEIKGLRGLIAQLQPKSDAYDNMAALIALLPKQSQSMGEDLAWKLDRRVQEVQAELNSEAKDAQ